ncbi:Qat anti-phage system TatD family nuclease QatD [Pontibacillus marinus]|uniref:TatD family hydrolase n=1 Tax=Pontibacillus marinus BH030004 = DSM 16465 TaxID=1385511 RepID=A0A0A5FWM3_9BACI|nr:Qat anti-phage system TatD family nuclease QatD [Pontibacillus marinus]KGX84324.1 hypothetical protein N783_17785 [Pontibacillus marinus BH030004 = DSM 16465]
MNKFYHDVHLHIDLYKDIEQTIDYIENHKSYTIAVTNLPVLYERIKKNYPNLKYIRFALGLHPELIHKYYKHKSNFMSNLKEARYIGEIGLDFKKVDDKEKKLQISIFKEIIDNCHNIGGKILSVHSRKAENEVIDLVGQNFNGKVILHWFNGNLTQLKKAVQYGCYFSINTQMMKSKNGKKLILNMPKNKILIESDGPFTKETEDIYSLNFYRDVFNTLCGVKGETTEVMNKILKSNFKNLLE